jgi:glycosyltransferase involved in cell wall biosynthesis
MQKTVAKINLKSIQNNAKIFKETTGVKLCAVVKANAYGHGGVEISNALDNIADFFAVALIEEGLEIRQAVCEKEILIFTPPTDENEVGLLLDDRFILTVDSLRTAKLIERVARISQKTIKVHLDYKFIMAIEGNDVASNLSWVMSSNSVAVMPRPTYETWFMEGRLIPNYHYIEVKPDFSDVEERLNYYIQHPEEAEEIIRNAHAYVDQFRDEERERLISLHVLDKYFKYVK